MAKGAREGAARAVGDTFGYTLSQAVQDLLKHGVERAKSAMDEISKDLMTAKGSMDDAAGSIIKSRYRKQDKDKYDALLRLLSHLTKPQQDDFVVVSICHLFLTTNKEGVPSAKEVEQATQRSRLLLDIDFTDEQTFSSLFELYDLIIADFLVLEKYNQANSQTVVELLQKNSLYGDETMGKRFADLLVRAQGWKEIPGKAVKGVGNIMAEIIDGATPTLSKIHKGITAYTGGTDHWNRVKEKLKRGN